MILLKVSALEIGLMITITILVIAYAIYRIIKWRKKKNDKDEEE